MRCPQYHGRKRRRRCNNAALPDVARPATGYVLDPRVRGVRRGSIAVDTWSLRRHATAGPVEVPPQQVMKRPVVMNLWRTLPKPPPRPRVKVKRPPRPRGKPKKKRVKLPNPIMTRSYVIPQVTRTLCAVPERDRPRSRNDRYRWYQWAVFDEAKI